MSRLFLPVCTEWPYLDVAGLLHQPPGVLGGSVALGELDSEEFEGSFEVRLQEVLFRCLQKETEWG